MQNDKQEALGLIPVPLLNFRIQGGHLMDLEYIGIAAALISSAAWAVGAILYKKLGEKIPSFGMNLAKGIINLVLMAIPLAFSDISAISVNTFILLGISGL